MAQIIYPAAALAPVINLVVTPSSVPAKATSVETFSVANGNIVSGSIVGLPRGTPISVTWDNPATPSLVGLVIVHAEISSTGVLQLTTENLTNALINPSPNIQLNISTN